MKILTMKSLGLLKRKQQLQDTLIKNAQEEEPLNLETVIIPTGNSPTFYKHKALFDYDLTRYRVTDAHMENIITSTKTPEDAALLSEVFKKWQLSPIPLQWDAVTQTKRIVDVLVGAGLQDGLFTLLANRWSHKLLPDGSDLEVLMQHYVDIHLVTKDDASLDAVYRMYAMFVYYDMLPGPMVYDRLVTTGFAGGTVEGARRSIVTFNEQKALGIRVLPKTQSDVDNYYKNMVI